MKIRPSHRIAAVAFGAIALAGIVTVAAPQTATIAGIELVRVPAGATPAFWLGKHEATQRQWETLMGKTTGQQSGVPNHPVEQISWYDAVEFCNALSRSAGWEHAGCRGREGRPACVAAGSLGTEPLMSRHAHGDVSFEFGDVAIGLRVAKDE